MLKKMEARLPSEGAQDGKRWSGDSHLGVAVDSGRTGLRSCSSFSAASFSLKYDHTVHCCRSAGLRECCSGGATSSEPQWAQRMRQSP